MVKAFQRQESLQLRAASAAGSAVALRNRAAGRVVLERSRRITLNAAVQPRVSRLASSSRQRKATCVRSSAHNHRTQPGSRTHPSVVLLLIRLLLVVPPLLCCLLIAVPFLAALLGTIILLRLIRRLGAAGHKAADVNIFRSAGRGGCPGRRRRGRAAGQGGSRATSNTSDVH